MQVSPKYRILCDANEKFLHQVVLLAKHLAQQAKNTRELKGGTLTLPRDLLCQVISQQALSLIYVLDDSHISNFFN